MGQSIHQIVLFRRIFIHSLKNIRFLLIIGFISITPLATYSQNQTPGDFAAATITAARAQVGVTVIYDPSYIGLSFPNGDFDRRRGVCTDVVIRALRDAHNIDLQSLVNTDMKAAFSDYPKIWGLRTTDRNIDHRRVPNLQRFFERKSAALPVSSDLAAYQPGDIVSWMLPGNLPHIGIISDRTGPSGMPLVIHNIGSGAQEEDILFHYDITGHYRLSPDML